MKKWIVLIIVVLLLAGGWYLFHGRKADKTELTIEVKKDTIVEKAQAVGYIKPMNSITVKSQIAGNVAKIYHYEGEYVKKGARLLEIQPTPAPAEYAAAYEAVNENRAIIKSAQRDLVRYQEAFKGGLIARDYDKFVAARKSYDTAKEQLTLAEQKLALLKKGKTVVAGENIANVIVSPIDGYILDRDVDVGDPVISLSSAQSATSLFTIANMNIMKFQGAVDEMDAAKIHVGMPAEVIVGSMSHQKISGILTRISLQSEQQDAAQGTKTTDTNSPFSVGFQVEVTHLQVPEGVILRSGYSATADIRIKTAQDVLILPERVIHFKQGKPYVLLPAKAKQQPQQQPIVIGLSDGMHVEIKQGLKLGDKVLDLTSDTAIAKQQQVPQRKKKFGRKKHS
jgi:HlyD family secretion protein